MFKTIIDNPLKFNIEDNYRTVKQFCRIIGITDRAVRKAINKGKLSAKLVPCNGGKQYLIDVWESYKNEPKKLAEFIKKEAELKLKECNQPNQLTYLEAPQEQGKPPNQNSFPALDFSLEDKPYHLLSDIEKTERNYQIYEYTKDFNRKKLDDYREIFAFMLYDDAILSSTKRCKEELAKYNEKFPEKSKCYESVAKAWKRYKKYGYTGIISGYGKNKGKSKVKKEAKDYFLALCLTQNQLEIKHCYDLTRKWALVKGHYTEDNFPSFSCFDKIYNSLPDSAKVLHREGHTKYDQNHAPYNHRDWSNVKVCEQGVSDHAQTDVQVVYKDGNMCTPWITVWRDSKSGMWLGWELSPKNPNQNNIINAFSMAAINAGSENFGRVFTYNQMDNGKDFRSNAFAGGKKHKNIQKFKNKDENGEDHFIEIDIKQISILGGLGVNAKFAQNFNGKTKLVERDFQEFQDKFSRKQPGYRGNRISNRPEDLSEQIKKGELLTYEEFEKRVNNYINNEFNLNKKPYSRITSGKSRKEAFDSGEKGGILVKKEALEILCAKPSKPMRLKSKGIYDRKNDLCYYASWMLQYEGELIVHYRKPNDLNKMWVRNAVTGELLGIVLIDPHTPAIAKTDEEKAILIMKQKRKQIHKKYFKGLKPELKISYEDLEKVDRLYNERFRKQEVIEKPQNKIDKVLHTSLLKDLKRIDKESKEGTFDITRLAQPERPKKPFLFTTKAEKEYWERTQKQAILK